MKASHDALTWELLSLLLYIEEESSKKRKKGMRCFRNFSPSASFLNLKNYDFKLHHLFFFLWPLLHPQKENTNKKSK